MLFCLAFVALLAVALVRGWVSVSWFSKESQDQAGATVSIDKNKIKEDVATVKNKAGDLQHRGDPQANLERGTETKVQGKVQAVSQKQLTLMAGDQPLTLAVAKETDIRVGGKQGTLAEIHPGDRVTVAYVTLENRHIARSLRKED